MQPPAVSAEQLEQLRALSAVGSTTGASAVPTASAEHLGELFDLLSMLRGMLSDELRAHSGQLREGHSEWTLQRQSLQRQLDAATRHASVIAEEERRLEEATDSLRRAGEDCADNLRRDGKSLREAYEQLRAIRSECAAATAKFASAQKDRAMAAENVARVRDVVLERVQAVLKLVEAHQSRADAVEAARQRAQLERAQALDSAAHEIAQQFQIAAATAAAEAQHAQQLLDQLEQEGATGSASGAGDAASAATAAETAELAKLAHELVSSTGSADAQQESAQLALQLVLATSQAAKDGDADTERVLTASMASLTHAQEPQCPPGMFYNMCAAAADCRATCLNPSPVCAAVCVPGCDCPLGTVRHDDRCIEPSRCPRLL